MAWLTLAGIMTDAAYVMDQISPAIIMGVAIPLALMLGYWIRGFVTRGRD